MADNKNSKDYINRKAQPRLRVLMNGDSEVNEARAVECGAVAVTDDERIDELKASEAIGPQMARSKEELRKAKKGTLKEMSSDVSVNVFIQTDTSFQPGSLYGSPIISKKGTEDAGIKETSRNSNQITARVRISDLPRLFEDSRVFSVELGETLRAPAPEVETTRPQAPGMTERKISNVTKHNYGEEVFVGIIDVGGFDFAHEDFLNKDGTTRFDGIWDQGGDSRPSPYEGRKGTRGQVAKIFDYGSELTAEHMNEALNASKTVGLAATELEPQSQMVPGSHGTHVASISAGNRGVARKARIAAVLLNIPREDRSDYDRRRRTFFDSTQLAHAVDYLLTLAAGRRISINISLGTNGHAHDGNSPINRWIDSWLNAQGAAVTAAAGNAGQEARRREGDIGYMLGRIHTSGRIPSRGLSHDIEWQVIGDGDQDLSENELEIWYIAQDEFSVKVKPPGMEWTEEVKASQYIENLQLPNKSFLSIYNERFHPANGLNYISIYLSPYMKGNTLIGSKTGLWKIRLRGIEVRDGGFDGWIERDDPRRIRIDGKTRWFLPSFFSEKSNIDNSSVSSLACGRRIISVANLDAPNESINVTSSQGPTRDGRTKPDVAAPGTGIVAAKGFSDDDRKWIRMSGTSMAAPYVAGVIALMLSVKGNLTPEQVEGIIRSTARPLPGASYEWIDSAGFGQIDPAECLKKAAAVNRRKDING